MTSPSMTQPISVCPRLTEAFALLGKRWNALIIDALSQRPARFCEVRRAVLGISDRVLDQRLKELCEENIVEHTGNCYELTERGVSLVPVLDAARTWAKSSSDHA